MSIMFITMIIGMVGCIGKKVTKTQAEVKTEILTKDSVHVEKKGLDSVKKSDYFYKDELGIDFYPPDTVYLPTSNTIKPPCPGNKIIYKTNGDVEVTGAIRNFNYQKSVLESKYDSLHKEYELEISNKNYWKSEASKVKTVEIKKKSTWWLWFIIGFVLATFISPVELFKRFFKI